MKGCKPAKLFIRKWKAQIIVGISSLLLFLFLSIMDYQNISIDNLKRDSYFGESRNYNLEVEGLYENRVGIELGIEKRKYTKEEADEIFALGMQDLENEILGSNVSFSEVSEDLSFINYIDERGISVDISPEDTELIDFDGSVLNAELKAGRKTSISVHLSIDEYSKEFILPIIVLPKRYDSQNKEVRELKSYIEKVEKEYSYSEEVPLPKEWKGKRLNYLYKVDSSRVYILVLGCIIGILLHLAKIQSNKERIKKRNSELLMDYPEIVSKLLIYLGAGLSIRNTLEELIKDYKKRGIKREAYEELAKVYVKISLGTAEGRAYRDFGRSIKLKQYLKLGSILEQNRRSGLSDLKEILEQETVLAWEERLNFAKRQGEEASTKLLLPLMLMLLMILMLITVPALLALS